jgi:hypothetical protein
VVDQGLREQAPRQLKNSRKGEKDTEEREGGIGLVGFGDWGWGRTFIFDIMSYISERDMALIWAARASPAAACLAAMERGSAAAAGDYATATRWGGHRGRDRRGGEGRRRSMLLSNCNLQRLPARHGRPDK